MKYILILLVSVVVYSGCRPKETNIKNFQETGLKAPTVLLREHQFLLASIDSIALMPDSTGMVAIKLKELMHHHFEEEEKNIFPVLALLPTLADDQQPNNSGEIIQVTDEIKKQHKHMIAEHQLIAAFLEELTVTARMENRGDLEAFKKAVKTHASAEESIYFPAAVLVGEYLKLKTKK